MYRILFGLVFTAILTGIALITTKVISVAFKLSSTHMRVVFLLFLLSILFFVISFIGSRSALLGPIPYTIANVLAGFLFYLFIGAIVWWIIWIAGTLFHLSLPVWVATLIFSLSVGGALLGIIEAKSIRVVRYNVHLPNSTAEVKGKTALLVSDTHFGLVNHVHFSDKVVEKILALTPSTVLHAGDFYDGPTIPVESISLSWKKLTEKIPVFYTPGNHETYGNYDLFISSVKNAGITVLEDTKTTWNGVQIGGITFRQGKESIGASTAIKNLALDPDVPSILINHPPTARAAAKEAGVDLEVSGHTHNGQFWPINYLVHAIYGKFAYGLQSDGDLTVITSKGVGTAGPPFRLFNRPELVLITFI